jgi:diaminobutyrate-2-oxoglutarate transaminase
MFHNATEEFPMNTFAKLESAVRSYARSFPVVFDRATGCQLFDTHGRRYLDFLAGAGTLNYGHNNPALTEALVGYIRRAGIAHGLDMHTRAKEEFLNALDQLILAPRNMQYRVQFTGPTGTNVIEAAFKVARKVTGRSNIIAFTNGFHGVSQGALAATGNRHHRGAAGIALGGVTHMPFDGYLGPDIDTSDVLRRMLEDRSSGVDLPAAIVVETVQGEGGLNVASKDWLKKIEQLCREHRALLIIDDIQAGCGRTGEFFSFESTGVKPDIITLSKSLSGYGLPMAVALISPQYDCWKPGEHNGTFRGNNHAFVTAAAALRQYWRNDAFVFQIRRREARLAESLDDLVHRFPSLFERQKGRGMMRGLACRNGRIAEEIARRAFINGLVIETSGPDSEVIKCLCPLTITDEELREGLDILARSAGEIAVTQAA